MVKKTFKLAGMHCSSCAILIEGDLEDKGVKAACSFAKQVVEVEFDPGEINEEEIKKTIKGTGYQVVE